MSERKRGKLSVGRADDTQISKDYWGVPKVEMDRLRQVAAHANEAVSVGNDAPSGARNHRRVVGSRNVAVASHAWVDASV